jgi:very-short-patch-repair endonuclease
MQPFIRPNGYRGKQCVPLLIYLHFDQLLTVQQIGWRTGISRQTITRNLILWGASPRSQSAAQLLRNQRRSPEERRAQIAAFHATIRGSKKPIRLIRKAIAAQAYKPHSANESMVYKALCEIGLSPVIGMPFDRFLLDIAFPNEKLAVEVDGGNWHTCPRKQKQDVRKTNFLASSGWEVIRIRIHRPNERTAEYLTQKALEVHSRLEQLRGHPTPPYP